MLPPAAHLNTGDYLSSGCTGSTLGMAAVVGGKAFAAFAVLPVHCTSGDCQ
jgi:hypothetical protein